MVSLINAADAAAQSQAATTIDVNEIMSNSISVRRLNYSDVYYHIEGFEVKKPEAAAAPQPQGPAPQVEVRINEQEGRVEIRQVGREKAEAAGELAKIAKAFGSGVGRVVAAESERAKKRLVMPTLSVQDQLVELEKIDEGIDEHVFAGDQTKVIIEDIRGLYAEAASENTEGMNEDQKELLEIRNNRVKSIRAKLGIR
ncbi:Uncharacterised protein [uncultured archaeon]|nr:Uncharacterised protein [uncultured archaeon]